MLSSQTSPLSIDEIKEIISEQSLPGKRAFRQPVVPCSSRAGRDGLLTVVEGEKVVIYSQRMGAGLDPYYEGSLTRNSQGSLLVGEYRISPLARRVSSIIFGGCGLLIVLNVILIVPRLWPLDSAPFLNEFFRLILVSVPMVMFSCFYCIMRLFAINQRKPVATFLSDKLLFTYKKAKDRHDGEMH